MITLEQLDNDRNPTGHTTEFEDEVAQKLVNAKKPFWRLAERKVPVKENPPEKKSGK